MPRWHLPKILGKRTKTIGSEEHSKLRKIVIFQQIWSFWSIYTRFWACSAVAYIIFVRVSFEVASPTISIFTFFLFSAQGRQGRLYIFLAVSVRFYIYIL